MSEFQIERNKYYYDRSGVVHHIVGVLGPQDEMYAKGYRFISDLQMVYPPNGVANLDGEPFDSDLVRELDLMTMVDHPEIGFDDHRIKFYTDNSLPLEYHPHIGPHVNREMNLMLAGVKPLTIVDAVEYPEIWAPVVEAQNWHRLFDDRRKIYYVSLTDESWRMLALRMIYDHGEYLTGALYDAHHAAVGRLLGYREEDVRQFIDRKAILDDIQRRVMSTCTCGQCETDALGEPTKERVLH